MNSINELLDKQVIRIGSAKDYTTGRIGTVIGIGKKYGFVITDILLVAHGGQHNDTICVKEIKPKP